MAKLTSTTYNSINEINRPQLETLNSGNNTYFTRDFLLAFESSNPTIDFKYILIEKEKKAIALALIQTVQLSIDVVLKNTKMPSFIRRFIYSLFCNDNINIMFCGNIFLSGEHGILIKDSENKTEVIRAICSKINCVILLRLSIRTTLYTSLFLTIRKILKCEPRVVAIQTQIEFLLQFKVIMACSLILNSTLLRVSFQIQTQI